MTLHFLPNSALLKASLQKHPQKFPVVTSSWTLCNTPVQGKDFPAAASSSGVSDLALSLLSEPVSSHTWWQKGLLHGDTVLKDYGAQTLMASGHFFPRNLLAILPSQMMTQLSWPALDVWGCTWRWWKPPDQLELALESSLKISCVIFWYDSVIWHPFASKGFAVHEYINHLGENRDAVLLAIYFLSSINFYSWNLLESSSLCAVESGKEDCKKLNWKITCTCEPCACVYCVCLLSSRYFEHVTSDMISFFLH